MNRNKLMIMSDKLNICVTCLSTDRRLVPVKKIAFLLQEINFIELNVFSGGICWECRSIMLKAWTLKRRAQIAQDSLSRLTEQHNLKPLTSLISTKLDLIHNIEFTHNCDPLTNYGSPKLETELIKTEIEDLGDDNLDSFSETDEKNLDIDSKTPEIDTKIEKVYVETIKSRKKDISLKAKVKKSKIDEREIREKFLEVVISEEEMFRSREEKRRHPNFKKLPYKCDSCVLGFTRKETCDLHLKKKHDETIGDHLCDVCSIRFSNKYDLDKHRKRHFICFRCKLCRYETRQVLTALNHCKMKHSTDEPNSIHCAKCDAVFTTPKELEIHTQSEHTLVCNQCGVTFKWMNSLRRHKVRIHGVKREFICDICTKTFSTKTRLESHMVNHNDTIAKKLAYCDICKTQYKNIYVYRNHLKYSANHSERAFACTECNNKFASKVYLKRHYNFYHLQKSQFHCDICNKLFISDWRLKNHRQTRHGLSRSRDHTCNVCGKKFYTLSTLRGHQLTHSSQRSYMCEDCGHTFKQRPALYTHARLLHKAK
ncbi:gastrula zinc finger protein XlCGF26.1-like [Trichoplusia ni]|uniref:Gastrula zinc finger protein XlCGF26.1-like n=1 Tax=Trichoplusia ni TaxID=7111 RepID=A0A7E5X606_TRINI|nr:gastrula zinc finger protein XlCGF26.1-like [Trichoplusia ni]